MKNFRKPKILNKFLLFILPFLILSITITSAILSWTSYTYFRKTIRQDYSNIIKSSAGEIRIFMENARNDLYTLSRVIAAAKLDQWQKKIALTAFNLQNEEFISVSLLTRKGKPVASTRWDDIDFVDDQNTLFQKVLSGQEIISGILLTGENLPYIHVAVPVKRLGTVDEVLWGELNLKSIWDILDGITIGSSGQVFIMDLSGRYIAHREIDRVVIAPPVEEPHILKEVRASNLPVAWIEKKEGSRFFCMGSYAPDFDWIIVLRQPLPEIYTYLYRNIYWSIFITGLVCLAAFLLGWNRIKRFLAPIHDLHRQVQIVGQGNLDRKVIVDSEDEIGDLGHAFNDMTASLKDYINREVETAKDLVHAKNLAVLGTASGKVTHEIGNLLNNVGMAVSTLQKETLSEKGGKTLSILERESYRAREFIQNFLQFAKKPELQLQRADICMIIREVVAVNLPEAEKRQIRIELEWAPEIPPVNIDSRLMYQAFNNLLINSMEAIVESGIIRIAGKIEADHILINTEDTGPGIDSDIFEKIFDPFFTTKGKKGTGLGLSIVKTIVESHRGTIKCKSNHEKGTVFIIRLPLKQ